MITERGHERRPLRERIYRRALGFTDLHQTECDGSYDWWDDDWIEERRGDPERLLSYTDDVRVEVARRLGADIATFELDPARPLTYSLASQLRTWLTSRSR